VAPFAECPVPGAHDANADTDKLIDAYLDQAGKSFDGGHFAEAYACADAAADLHPVSVEAHHLRASALAALGKDEQARVAYTMALALDPEDELTLMAAADFYINVTGDKSRDTLMVGLELARRGSARAVARRRGNRDLRARLALLEAQASNDLGHSDEALERADEALRLQPEMPDARHERGVALFNLCRFEPARQAFEAVLAGSPDDPYAHNFLGLVDERLGKTTEAESHFARARALAPDEFPAPVLISPAEFRAEIDAALAGLDAELRAMVAPVPIEVVDVPAVDDLTAVDPPFAPTILGLYRGLPHGMEPPPPRKGEAVPPRSIVLYRVNLARAVKTRAELSEQIKRTLLHEIGHLRGLDEDDLRRRGLD
jgi:Flp pilus assembly protein TadD/predicted Zn-dependent protease with MMP-like domain